MEGNGRRKGKVRSHDYYTTPQLFSCFFPFFFFFFLPRRRINTQPRSVVVVLKRREGFFLPFPFSLCFFFFFFLWVELAAYRLGESDAIEGWIERKLHPLFLPLFFAVSIERGERESLFYFCVFVAPTCERRGESSLFKEPRFWGLGGGVAMATRLWCVCYVSCHHQIRNEEKQTKTKRWRVNSEPGGLGLLSSIFDPMWTRSIL